MDKTYEDRVIALKSIGFNSYKEYLESPLWLAIKKEVFIRDACQCRVKYCADKGCKQAHHLSYSRIVLLGLDSSKIVTVCIKHHKEIEYDKERKRSLDESRWKTIQLVTGSGEVFKGKSERRIGNWFRNQTKASYDTGVRVIERLKRESPEWHRKLASLIQRAPAYAVYRQHLL